MRDPSATRRSPQTRWPAVLSILAAAVLLLSASASAQEGVTARSSNLDTARDIVSPLMDLSEGQLAVEPQVDAYGNKVDPPVTDAFSPPSADLITASTYVFSASSGASLEDMSSGSTVLLGNNLDDTASGLTALPFDFWFDGVRATQFSVNANGEMRLGNTQVGATFSNALASITDAPKLATYWDDLWIGFNGKVHYKTVGSAPNRKLVVEWLNMQVPRVANGSTGSATFQAWLFESTGVIEFVYGNGLGVNSANGGYTVGIQSGVATNFAAVTTATGTVSYAAAADTQTTAIVAGTKYSFAPVAPAAPTSLNFTGVGGTSQTLNWTDNSSNELGFLIYRSTDGVDYSFITQTAAGAVTSTQNNLGNAHTYFWRVVAISEGAMSAALSGSQASLAGTLCGTLSVGPTGTYLSLTAAFADITANGLSCPVILELQAAYVSSVETYPLAPPVNASPSATITVRPEVGATGLSITGANSTALIDLNGASFVTIDGRPGGAGSVRDMTISNTGTGATIRFINGASNNTLRFLQLRGVSTTASLGGVVFFSTTTAVTGNNSNTIDNNDIRDGATAPVNGIASTGTTTLGLENNRNTVSNNSIFNFFGATTDHNGILLGAGNTNWTLSGNSIFNTNATLNITGSSIVWHGIQFSSATGSWGHTVSGNFIGGTAVNGGGAALTLTGSGVIRATRFTTGAQIPSSIQGNAIGNFNLTSSSAATGGVGLGLVTGAFNAGDISPNTVSNWTLNITGTASLWRGISAGTGTAGITVVANNVVTNITNAPTSLAQFQGIGIQGTPPAMTVSGNTVGSTSVASSISMSAAAVSFFGISSSASGAATYNFSNNFVGNVTSTGTGAFSMVGLSISSGGYSIVGNTVRNLTTASTGTSGTLVGINATATTSVNQFLSQNTIRSLNSTAPSAGVVLFGVIYNGPTSGASVVSRNLIHSIAAVTTSTAAEIDGIRISNGNATIQNNMVRLGFFDDATPTSITTGLLIGGIVESGGTSSIYHNSLYIGGTGVVSATNTGAFVSSLTSGTRAVRDNILANDRQNASGTAANTGALFLTALTLPSPAGLTMSNNVYASVDAAGAVRNGTAGTAYSVAGWQGASAQDGGSFAATPAQINFVNAGGSSSTVDLHVQSPTAIEQTGAAVAVVDDFDGQARGTLTPVDIGADAGTFTAVDIAAPTITYAPLGNTGLTTNRMVSATIADGTGVAAGADLPRMYFKKATDGAYVSTQCVMTGGTAQNGTYDCTIDYSLVGGGSVAVGDTIQYFVVAQDTAGTPNVGSTPGGVVAASVNTITTPPVPALYGIVTGFGGVGNPSKTVCASGCDFTSLTNAGGVFEALNGAVLTGNFIVSIGGDLTGELGTNAFNQQIEEGVGAGTFTVIIKPDGGSWTVTGSAAAGLIRLNAADRVTIDGSQSGGTDRSLTITNTNSGTTSAVVWLQSNGANGATANTIKNLNVVGNSNTTTQFGIGAGSATVGTTSLGTGNNSNTYQNNSISKVQYGIYSQGASGAAKNSGNVFTGNVMTAASPDHVARGGILLGFEDWPQVTRNLIDGVTLGGAPDVFGIALGLTAISTSSFTGNEVTNATVTDNLIGKVTNTGTYSAAGITVASATSGTTLIANNFIHGVGANGTGGDFGAGIFLGGGVGSTTRVYFNSVSMTGSFTGGNYPNYGLAIGGVDPLVDVRDNVLYNTQSNGTGVSFAIGTASAAFTNLTSDSNDLFVTAGGGLFKVGKTGSLAQGSGTEHTLLGDWQVATGKDVSSLAVDPLFVSPTDLHLQVGSPVLNAGVALAAVTVDFDGEPRPGTGPDIGADEVVQADLAITKNDGVATVLPGGSTTYTIVASNLGNSNANGAVVADTFPVELSCSTTCVGAGGASCTAGPFLTNINDTVNLPAGGSVTYTAVCAVSGTASGSISNTATVTPPVGVGDPNAANDSATDVDGVGSATADLAITKDDGVTTATPGSTVTYTLVATNLGPSPVAAASAADTFPAACASVSYTSVAAGGATGNTAAGAGNIADSLGLPAGGSVTYTAICTLGAGATGSLANTATIGSAVFDPTPANNSATDTDTLSPSANLSITKTDGVTTATAGGTLTYTIVASNAGPSHAPGSTVVDTFPSSLSCSTTCSGSGGGTCTAGPFTTSINDTVNLPSGASVTYTAVCTVAMGTTGSVRNTATVATGGGITDPTPGNNSATDEDTIPGAALFSDGFETGNLTRWGSAQTLFHAYQVVSVGGASAVEVGYDLAALPSQAFEPSAIAVAATGGRTLFTVVARRVAAGAAAELSLEVAGGGASSWVTASGTRMRFDWSVGGEGGHVAISIDGRLALWVSGFATEAPPAAIELLQGE